MAITPTVVASGTTTSTVGTEIALGTMTGAGVYQTVVDVTNLASGTAPDILQMGIYSKVINTSGTEILSEPLSYLQGVQTLKEWRSNVFGAPSSHYVPKLKQVAGSARAFIWAIYQY